MTIKEQVLDLIKRVSISEKGYCDTMDIFDLLTHRIETEIPELQVKQLVWDENIATAFVIDENVYNYEIEQGILGNENYYNIWFDGSVLNTFYMFDDTEAYAQQHFEGLIKSCLEGNEKL